MICEKVPAIARDVKLKALFESNCDASPVDMVKAICVVGSQAQRSRLASIMEPRHGLAMDALVIEAGNRESHKAALGFLKAQLQSLADFYGCQVAGDLADMADVLFESHCDLSILDFTLFFQYVKQGRYKGEFEHIAVRGINMQFVNAWMDGYRSERDDARQMIYNEIKGRQLSEQEQVQGPIYEKYIEMVKKRENEQKSIRDMRVQWLSETQNSWQDKIHMVANWAFADDPEKAIDKMRGYLVAKTKPLDDPKSYYLPTIAPILNAISGKFKKEGAAILIFNALNSMRSHLQTPDALWEKVFPGTSIPDKWFEKDYGQICSVITSGIVVRIEKSWPAFREKIVSTKDAIPFDQAEYMHQRAVIWLKEVDIKNPMWDYLDHILSV